MTAVADGIEPLCPIDRGVPRSAGDGSRLKSPLPKYVRAESSIAQCWVYQLLTTNYQLFGRDYQETCLITHYLVGHETENQISTSGSNRRVVEKLGA